MDVSVIIPAQAWEGPELAASLEGVFAQRYDAGRVEVFVVQYDGGSALPPVISPSRGVRLLAVDHPSPYVARNLAASSATGDVLLFTEPGCVPEPDWAAAHVARLRDSAVTVSVGHVAPARMTRLVGVFLSYEGVRDAWVFSCPTWNHYFGRPKNMAVARHRFQTHGPFAEVIRGADSKLVQAVARELSCDEVGLAPRAIVRQQSVRGLPSCYRDRFRHAFALATHRSGHAAPISLERRVQLFRDTLDQRRYGPVTGATLLALLAGGILTFRLGGLAGRIARRRHA
jgi:hypothetical protein